MAAATDITVLQASRSDGLGCNAASNFIVLDEFFIWMALKLSLRVCFLENNHDE
jgi:hypothetical protein